MPRREIKRTILSPFEPANYYGDVWLVTERDNGMILEGSRTDLVVIKTEEHANAGYLWQFGDLSSAGLEIRSDARAGTPDHVGGIVYRTVIAEASGIVSGHLNLREVRPWQKGAEPLNSLEMEVDLYGPVAAGLLPLQREAALQEAA